LNENEERTFNKGSFFANLNGQTSKCFENKSLKPYMGTGKKISFSFGLSRFPDSNLTQNELLNSMVRLKTP